MRTIKYILAILIMSLYLSNYQICDYFFYDDLMAWWDLRMNLYSVNFLLFSLLVHISSKGNIKSFMLALMLLCLGDVVDRIFFNITTFEDNDILFLVIVLIVFIIDIRNVRRGQELTD